ncbi:WYL domain-containing protein [Lactococcus lactis]|uniref:helix-turn-helix transcriptional regulator n=1 Tax=Lactococcus lactis TaxID=1358 RepID=UPI0028900147|nr:WYL domain-containing protein [Lactococcus lactis]MDT2882862.1 WYL domain-containing protein [Lactococcus lactis]MDT2901302.1 WYL domain-containing protein [Lactococcus lactis]MDT2920336.1 WYL domain-containing protein [Lactococcus lactis]MDT2940871.1 WYL domain-containing protein [Lactococcus lactis]
MFIKNDKTSRVLRLNERLNKGEYLRKQEIEKEFDIPSKTFDRDIKFLREFYFETDEKIVYDKTLNAYYLLSEPKRFTKKEVYALCKILIESRAFNHYEFNALIDKLLRQCNIKESKEVSKLIGNQRLHYIELKHGKDLINRIWEIATSVRNQNLISFEYQRQDGTEKKHHVKPVGIVFSEFYFYLLAYHLDANNDGPTIYRVDRVKNLLSDGEKFTIPYSEKFSESEFYKRILFMNTGELQHIRFKYTGVLEALLDRIPTAKIEQEIAKGEWIIRAEAFGEGLMMWLRSQGERVLIIGDQKNEK